MLLAVGSLVVGVASCSSDDDASDDGAGSSMELTPNSDEDGEGDTGDEDDTAGEDDADEGDADQGSGDGPRSGSAGAVEPVELSEAEEAYRDGVMEAMGGDVADTDLDLECLAGRWIKLMGLDRLEAAGVTPDLFVDQGPTAFELTDAEALEFVRDYERCGMDPYDFILSPDLDEEVRSCIVDEIDVDDLESYMVASIRADDDEMMAMQDEVSSRTEHCIS